MKKSLIVSALLCVLSACGGGRGDSNKAVENFNSSPVANAGIDQNVLVNDVVSIDASKSVDPEGDQLNYFWQFSKKPDNSQAVLTSTTTKAPSFIADVVGAFELSLTVSDGQLSSEEDDVVINVNRLNTPPIANAGEDQDVILNSIVNVNGSASADPDTDQLTYAWQFVKRPDNSQAQFSSPSVVTPSFIADAIGTFELSLTVSDGQLLSEKDNVVITVNQPNTQPVANAGRDQNVTINSTVWLDGSNSSDAESQPLNYHWQFITKPQGSVAELVSASSVIPNFSVDLAGTYEIELIVDDTMLNSLPDVITVISAEQNNVPISHAGNDQSLKINSIVQLDGSESYDADNDAISFSWSVVEQPENSQIQLSSMVAKNPTFFATEPGLYSISLAVSDSLSTSETDIVEIIIEDENTTPIARAGADQQKNLDEIVYLDGSNSTDADGDDLSYAWFFVSRPEDSSAAFNNASSIEPSFILDKEGEYVVKLIVTDDSNASSTDNVVVTTVSEDTLLTGVVTGALIDTQGKALVNVGVKVNNSADTATNSEGVFSHVLQVAENDTIRVEIADERFPYVYAISKKITKNPHLDDYDFNVSLFTQKVPVYNDISINLFSCSSLGLGHYSGPQNIDVVLTLTDHESTSFTVDYQLTTPLNVDGSVNFLLPAYAKYHVSIEGYNVAGIDNQYQETIELIHYAGGGIATFSVCDK